MKNVLTRIMMLLIVMATFTSCKLIKVIFEAGMFFGIFIVVAIIALIIFLISKIGGGKNG